MPNQQRPMQGGEKKDVDRGGVKRDDQKNQPGGQQGIREGNRDDRRADQGTERPFEKRE